MSTVALATGISLGRLPTAALLEIESNGTLLSKFKGTSKQNDIYCWLNPFMGTCVIGLCDESGPRNEPLKNFITFKFDLIQNSR